MRLMGFEIDIRRVRPPHRQIVIRVVTRGNHVITEQCHDLGCGRIIVPLENGYSEIHLIEHENGRPV